MKATLSFRRDIMVYFYKKRIFPLLKSFWKKDIPSGKENCQDFIIKQTENKVSNNNSNYIYEAYADYDNLPLFLDGYVRISRWVDNCWTSSALLNVFRMDEIVSLEWIYRTIPKGKDSFHIKKCLEALEDHLYMLGYHFSLKVDYNKIF